MMQKIKTVFNHPYAAPIATPLKWIGKMTASEPVKNFFTQEIPDNLRMMKEMWAGRRTPFSYLGDSMDNFPSFLGTALGGSAGLGLAAIIALKTSLWLPAKIALCAAAPVAGMLLGPLVLVTGIAAVGGAVGCLLAPLPGFVKGCTIALQHRRGLAVTPMPTAPGPVSPSPPALAAPRKETVENLLADMTPAERQKKLADLFNKFSDDYEALSRKKARDSVVLQHDIEAPRLILKNPAPTAKKS